MYFEYVQKKAQSQDTNNGACALHWPFQITYLCILGVWKLEAHP